MDPLDEQLLLTIFTNNSEINSLSAEKKADRIKWIMDDLDKEGIFEEFQYDDLEEELVDEMGGVIDAYCGGEMSIEEAKEEANSIAVKQSIITQQTASLLRIRKKRHELSKNPESEIVLEDDDFGEIDVSILSSETEYPYGRSALHHAIAMMDLKSVEEMIKNKKYLNSRDNNGDTPLEMARNQGNKVVIKLFKKYNIV